MAEIILTKDEQGKLVGLDESHQRRWQRFLNRVKALGHGATVKADFKLPRSPKFHRLHFAILKRLFDSQEQFQDFDRFREWVQIGAGFCDIMPGPKGKPVAVSRSIAWERLGDEDFAEHHKAVLEFVRSVYYVRFIWPHMEESTALLGIENILEEFDA